MEDIKKDIMITIKDSHVIDDKKESYEITTHGKFYGEKDNYTIEYDEQYDELKGCHTVLKITGGSCVSLVRTGAYNSELVIEKNKRHNCQYNTPYGAFLMGIFASKVKSDIIEGKGVLDLKYTIDFYGGIASENEMKITIS